VVVTCKTGTFPALAVAVAMTVDGVAMKAAHVLVEGLDGGTTRIVAVRVL